MISGSVRPSQCAETVEKVANSLVSLIERHALELAQRFNGL